MMVARSMVILVNNIERISPLCLTIASCFTILVVLPFFVIWTGLGTYWYVEIVSNSDESCVRDIQLPFTEKSWVILIWLGFCYVIVLLFSVAVGAALASIIRERRQRSVFLMSERLLIDDTQDIGFNEEELQIMGRFTTTYKTSDTEEVCSICFDNLQEGDIVTHLPRCAHNFHVACISGWLKIKPLCPNCKANLRTIIE